MPYVDNVKAAIQDCYFNQTNITAPAAIWCSLHSANPGNAGSSELSGNGYARVNVTTSFPAATPGSPLANNAQVAFAKATGSNWTAATYFGIWTLVTGGTFLGYGALTASQTVLVGNRAVFDAGDLTITES